MGVALERPAMELAQLDRSHVGGNEGEWSRASQEILPVRVALERPAMELAQLDGPHVGGNAGKSSRASQEILE